MSVNTTFAAGLPIHATNALTPWATVRRVQTIFTVSTALVILILALLSSLHGRENVSPRFLSFKYILGSRIIVGLAIFTFGLGAQDWTGIELFAVVWFLWFMLTIFNIVGMQPLKESAHTTDRSWDRAACH